MMAATPSGWFDGAFSGRCRGDDGVALLEAGILTPVLMFLILGIFDGSGLGRTYLSVSNATSAGVRTAAIDGNDNLTDYDVLVSVKKGLPGISMNQVNRVVVFKAANATAGPSCTTGSSVANLCNVYGTADLNLVPQPTQALALNYFGNCPTTIRDCFWNPTTRKVAVAGTNGPPDYVGVYVQMTYKYATGLFGTTKVIGQSVVSKIEPQSLI